MTRLLVVLLLSAFVPGPLWAGDPPKYEIVTAAPGVLAFIQNEPGIGNSIAIVTEIDVLVVDATLTPAEARDIIAAIRKHTDKPIRYVVNTHWHDDHIWGNQAFARAFRAVEIVAHVHTRDDILGRAFPTLSEQLQRLDDGLERRAAVLARGTDDHGKPLSEEARVRMADRLKVFTTLRHEFDAIEPTPPTLTFRDELSLYRGDEEIRLLYLGRGNTRGDVVVYLPARKVLITGDLLTHPFPAAAEVFMSDWILALEQLAELDVDVIIPGHGPVLHDKEYLRRVRLLLETVLTRAREAMNEGLSLESALAAVQVDDLRADFVEAGTSADAGFDRFFLQPAIQSVYAERAHKP